MTAILLAPSLSLCHAASPSSAQSPHLPDKPHPFLHQPPTALVYQLQLVLYIVMYLEQFVFLSVFIMCILSSPLDYKCPEKRVLVSHFL